MFNITRAKSPQKRANNAQRRAQLKNRIAECTPKRNSESYNLFTLLFIFLILSYSRRLTTINDL